MCALATEMGRLGVLDSLFVGGAYTVEVLGCDISDDVFLANGSCVPPWTCELKVWNGVSVMRKGAETTY